MNQKNRNILEGFLAAKVIRFDNTAIMVIIFWGYLMFYHGVSPWFYQKFFWPPVKRSGIISNKHGIYKLPHDLSNNFSPMSGVEYPDKKEKDLGF